jgi:hypothetical protein
MSGDAVTWAYAGNPYRDGKWTSQELLREREHVRWLLAEVDLEGGDVRLSRSRYAPRVRQEPGWTGRR